MTPFKSLAEFILEEQRQSKGAKGDLTKLLIQIEQAGKILSHHIQRIGLSDLLLTTGTRNASLDEVIKLDSFSHSLFLDTLIASGQVHAIGSEELEKIYFVEKTDGEYVVFLDPLDGSKNTEVNITIGTIFSIYHKNDLLKPGTSQVAAGYILYGPSVIFVYTTGQGVHGFTLDPETGTFLLSHPDIKIPLQGEIYSMNEGNYEFYDNKIKRYITHLKQTKKYKARYIGSMVADIHRTLLKGGIFLYPSDSRAKEGKLRLLFEVNPLSFLMKHAGGLSTSERGDPLLISPSTLHECAPVVMGSKVNVEEYLSFMK